TPCQILMNRAVSNVAAKAAAIMIKWFSVSIIEYSLLQVVSVNQEERVKQLILHREKPVMWSSLFASSMLTGP
ncbi:MAG: hypothetical protein ACJ04P_05815, partial [Halioglobus sp.]